MAETLSVYFVTNRNEEPSETPDGLGFGRDFHRRSPLWLRYGMAEMRKLSARSRQAARAAESVPGESSDADPALAAYAVKRVVVMEEKIPETTENDPKRVLGSKQAFEHLRQALLRTPGAEVVVLIHGYSCTFENALSNAAEIKAKWSTPGKPLEVVVFTWPSDGRTTPFLAYKSDRDDARGTAKAIARAIHTFHDYMLSVLRDLPQDQWCRRKIHLVAHSMGNYVLRNALQALISDLGGKALPLLFENIFLMAADEDDDAFESDGKLALLPSLSQNVFIYFSGRDGALTISDLTKFNPDRLGTHGPRVLTNLPRKVVLVDCSFVSDTSPPITDVHHQYYRRRKEVIEDIRLVLAGGGTAAAPGRVWIESRRCFQLSAARQR